MSAVVARPFTDPKVRAVEVIAVEDHDRIMSERDELWKRATKFVMPGEMDTGESIEHYIKTLERTIAELRAEVEKAQSIAWDRKCKAREHELTIATQARVIEKLKGMVSHYETCAMADSYDDEIVPCDCGLEKELAAIEKEGAKDE